MGDVGDRGGDVAADSRQSLARSLEPVVAQIRQHDGRAGLGEPPGAREAEPLRGARDERDLPAQVDELRVRLPLGRHSHTL